jgi:hypothetical protein
MTWTWFLREFVSNELHATSNKDMCASRKGDHMHCECGSWASLNATKEAF